MIRVALVPRGRLRRSRIPAARSIVADDAGALLVRAGLIADQALSSARSAQRHTGGTLGEHLVAGGAVADDALTEFYRSRLMVPQVSPTTLAKLPPTVTSLLPADMAVEFRVMPVSLDKDGNLTVAMSDPSDRHAVDEIGFFTGKYVVRAVATQMQIAWCLAHYYDYVTELAERLMQPVATMVKAPAPTPSAAPTPSRARGDTAKVDAARHRVLVPVTTPPPIAPRPDASALERSAPHAARPARAASVLPPPPPPDDDDEPEITAIEAEEPDESDGGAFAPEPPLAPKPPPGVKLPPPVQLADDAFGSPTVVVSAEATRPQRTRPAAPDPPELAARSGELQFHIRDGRVDAPAVTIEINLGDEPALDAAVVELDRRRASPPPVTLETDGEVSAPAPLADRDDLAIVHDTLVDTESAPILLEHFRRGEPPPTEAPNTPEHTTDEPSGPVLLLERKKRGVIPRRDKHTVLGIGLLGPIPRSTEPPPLGPRSPTLAPPVGGAPFSGSVHEGRTDTDAEARAAAADAAPPAEAVPTAVTDEEAATRRVEVEVRPGNVDDGWEGDTAEKFGPPGTTIPPPFLGAALPIDDPPSGRIPLATSDGDSSRLVVGTTGPVPVPRDTTAPTGPSRSRTLAPPPDAAVLARQLEEASLALVDLLRGLDGATSRDHVIAMLVDFVGSSHHRVAFLAAKGGVLTAFMQVPPPVAGADSASLSLSTPSTFQDVVGTRLPYRGPIGDAASRGLVKAMFGSPTDDILAVPVAVRDRVVGVIYADGRHRHSYDEHVTVAGRAAGLALERVLKGKRGT